VHRGGLPPAPGPRLLAVFVVVAKSPFFKFGRRIRTAAARPFRLWIVPKPAATSCILFLPPLDEGPVGEFAIVGRGGSGCLRLPMGCPAPDVILPFKGEFFPCRGIKEKRLVERLVHFPAVQLDVVTVWGEDGFDRRDDARRFRSLKQASTFCNFPRREIKFPLPELRALFRVLRIDPVTQGNPVTGDDRVGDGQDGQGQSRGGDHPHRVSRTSV